MSKPNIGLALVLIFLGASTLALARRSEQLERRLAHEEARLETLARLLEPTAGHLAAEPLDRILDEQRSGVADARSRLEAIQDRMGAAGRVVREAGSATALLQGGAYGFRDPETGEELRLVPGPDGRVVAVNAAVLPEFGGSHLGIPAAEALALLDATDPRPTYHRE